MDFENVKKLIFAIIYQALRDLKSPKLKLRNEAEEFLLSDTCRVFCKNLNINHNSLKKINYENPVDSINLNVKYKRKPRVVKKKISSENELDKYLNKIFNEK